MQEITTTAKNLPQTIEEKTAYVLFGSDALNAYRKKLKAIQSKYGISSEQYKQIQLEAQETAENLLLFSADIGEAMMNIPKAQGARTDKELPDVNDKKLKTETIHGMGFTDRQARDFQTLARHPETVQRAIEDARAEDRIVTRQDVLNRIAPQKSEKQRIKDIKDKAREEHKTFEESSKNGVVNFEDIKNDKDNVELIALDTSMTINRSFSMITSLGFLKEKDIDLMAEHMTTQGRLDMISKGRDCIRVITQILKHIDRR